jgi:hypothetical protein
MAMDNELLQRGICRVAVVDDGIDWLDWAAKLSQPTLDSITFEGDSHYAFYRNIQDEPDFPFSVILNHVAGALQNYFDVNSLEELRMDDAFCVHYNTSQKDSSGAKHTDPSDITINMCLETSDDIEGSQVKFYGTKNLHDLPPLKDDSASAFLVKQRPGYATIHWGDHPHETLPIKRGRRTNIIMTLMFKDKSRSQAANRTCYY